MKRKRATIVKSIHRVYTYGDSFGALCFGKFSPYAGDLVCIHLALCACEVYGIKGIQMVSLLMGVHEIEKKTGFVNYSAFQPIYGKALSANTIKTLYNRGLLERVPFPETFSHIKRRVKCYKVSDKGHKCLRMFRDTYNELKREQKRAAIRAAETL